VNETPSTLEITAMRNSTVQYLHARRGEIEMNPLYQRQGEIWTVDKQQLLIDSLINEFDVPKIYFHQFPTPKRDGDRMIRWALIDGRQRLEAIFGFLDNNFPLSSEFVYLADSNVDAAGKTYSELTASHPSLVSTLNATKLDVITIRTDDLELIEEMFSRLNEAVPLNAAEKRNALGGPMPQAVRELIAHPFFIEKLPFTNRRYRHYDLAAKFLYWTDQRLHPTRSEGSLGNNVPIRDVKKVRLDTFFKEVRRGGNVGQTRAVDDARACRETLDVMMDVFVSKDGLLSSIGMVSIYYLLAEQRVRNGRDYPERSELAEFEQVRKVRRTQSEDELRPGEYEMLEFARLSQSPNDGRALAFRLNVLDTWLTARAEGRDPMQALDELFVTQD
jgi:hypothetical protein